METDQGSTAPAQPTTVTSGNVTVVPAAGAASGTTTAPATVSAADQAVAANDVAAYRDARRVERGEAAKGAPAPVQLPPEAKPSAAKGPAQTPPDPGSNRQQRLQERINGYERQIAELRAENERLRPSPAERGRRDLDRGPSGEPAMARAAQMGDPLAVDITRPALEEAAFYTQFPQASTTDYQRYMIRFEREVERATERMQAAQQRAAEAAHERAVKFHDQIKAGGDPAAIIDRLDPALVALETRAYARAQGKPISAANDLAEEILDSEVALQVLEHLTAHPDVKETLLKSADRRALVRRFRDLEKQFTPAAQAAPALKTTTDAPPPAVTLGSRAAQLGDPVDAAVARGDVAGYREARRAQRAALMR